MKHKTSQLGEVHSLGGRMLLAVYAEGDCDYPKDRRTMHMALYDLHQTEEVFADGDEIETPFGNFKASGVHIVEVE